MMMCKFVSFSIVLPVILFQCAVSVKAKDSRNNYDDVLIQPEAAGAVRGFLESLEEKKRTFSVGDDEKGFEWDELLQNIIVPFPQLDLDVPVGNKLLRLDVWNGRCYCDIDVKAQTAKRTDKSISNKIELHNVEFRCELDFKLTANNAIEEEGALQFLGFGDNMAVITSHEQQQESSGDAATNTKSIDFCETNVKISNVAITKSKIVSHYLAAGFEEIVVQMLDEELNSRDLFCGRLERVINMVQEAENSKEQPQGLSADMSRILLADESNSQSRRNLIASTVTSDKVNDDDNDDNSYKSQEENESSDSADLIASAIRDNVPQVSSKILSLITSLMPDDAEQLTLIDPDDDEFVDSGDSDGSNEEERNDDNGDNEDEDWIDFRDLLLPSQEAISMGGSGFTYSRLAQQVFAMMKDRLLSTNDNGDLNMNEMVVQPMTEILSGTPGMLQFAGDIVDINTDTMIFPFNMLPPIQFRVYDFVLENADILVPPVSIMEPTTEDYHLENHLNFGPSPDGRKLNATVSALLNVSFGNGSEAMNLLNEIDFGFTAESFEMFMDVLTRISYDRLLDFPLSSVLEPTCWLTLMPRPVLDDKGYRIDSSTSPEQGLSFKSMVIRPSADTRLVAECIQCNSRGAQVIPELLDIFHYAGVTELMVQRIETLIEEFVLSDMVQTELDRFLYLSALTCPHSPEYNASSVIAARKEFPVPEFPELSSQSLDTLLFTILHASEMSAVVLAEVFTELLLDDYRDGPLYQRNTYEPPEGLKLLNYMDLGFKYADYLFEIVRDVMGGTIKDPETDDRILLIYYILEHVLFLDNGLLHVEIPDSFSTFDIEGLRIRLNYLNVTGLDSITHFDVAEPIGPQEIRNNISFANLGISLDFSLDHIATDDPEQNFTVTVGIEDFNMTASVIAAFDLDLLSSLNVGSLMNMSTALDCLVSTAHELQVTELLVGMSSINEIRVDGLLPESSEIFHRSQTEIMEQYGENIINVFPAVMDVFMRAMANEGLNLLRMSSSCPVNQTIPNTRFVDFNEFFSRDGEYGPIPAYGKDAMDSVINANDPVTNWPIINSAFIGPLTERVSGVEGMMGSEGDLFALSMNLSQLGLPDFGLGDINVRLFDTYLKNLHSVVPPVEVFEPNVTNGFFVDNRATIGARDRPFHFTMKSMFEMTGIHNELEFNLELREASFFAVMMVMMGTKELYSMELGNLMKFECLLSLFTIPEMDYAVGLALKHLEGDLSSLDVDLSCNNCTSAGLMELPSLVDKLKDAGIINVLFGRIIGEFADVMMVPSLVGAANVDGSLGSIVTEFSSAFTAKCPSSIRAVPDETQSPTDESHEKLLSQISPQISADTVETVIFAVGPVMQIGIVVVAESLAAQNLTERDPLWGENELVVPESVNLLDFSASESSTTIEALNLGISLVNEMLATPMPLSDGGGSQLGINSMIGSLLDDDGVLYIDTSDLEMSDFETITGNNSNFLMDSGLSDVMGDISGFLNVTLSHVRIVGLDSFTKAEVMKVIGSQTFRSAFSLRSIELELEILIETIDESLSYTISFGAQDIDASISMLIALDEDKMGDLEIGSLLNMDNLLPCFLSFSHDLKITEFDVDVSSVKIFDVTGFRSSQLRNASEELRDLIDEHYGETIAHSVSALFNGPVVTIVNEGLQQFLDGNTACPAVSSDFDANTFVDFRDLLLPRLESLLYGGSGTSPYGDVLPTTIKVLRRIYELGPAEELSDLNFLLFGPWDDFSVLNETLASFGLSGLTSTTAGSYEIPGALVDIDYQLEVAAGISTKTQTRVSNLRIENVDTIGAPMSLLEAVMNEPYMLNNTASIGVGDRPLRISAELYLRMDSFGYDIVNHFVVSVDLHQLTLALTTLTKILERRFLGFPIRDASNLDCWLATLPVPALDRYGFLREGAEPSVGLEEVLATVANMNLEISCIACAGPALDEINDLMAAPGARGAFTRDVNSILKIASALLGGDLVSDQISQMLVDASRRCPHSPDYDATFEEVEYRSLPGYGILEQPNPEVTPLLIVVGIVMCVAIFSIFCVKRIVSRRSWHWLSSLPKYRLFLMKREEEMEKDMEAALNATMSSLFQSPVIPVFARYFIPLTILGNIGLFLSGHLSLGGAVVLNIDLFGLPINVDGFFPFSIGPVMLELFSQGAIGIALTALLFSIIWPYTKQMISLFFWFIPPKRISVSMRGSVYIWLDLLAKWSMMDVFILIANVAGLWLKVSLPEIEYLPDDLMGFSMVLVPMWGLYANLLAQLISQISSHFIIHYHRKAVECAIKEYEQTHGLLGSPVPESLEDKKTDAVSGEEASGDVILASEILIQNCSSESEYEKWDVSHTEFTKPHDHSPEVINFEGDTGFEHSNESCEVYALCKHEFIRPHRGEYDKLIPRKFVNSVLIVMCILICILVVLGCVLPSFSNEALGMMGIMLSWSRGTEEAVDIYSVLTLCNTLTEMSIIAGPEHLVGVGLMSGLVVVSVMIVPVALAVTLLCQWFLPLTRATRHKVYVAIEILEAWQYADVFLISMIIETWRQEFSSAVAYGGPCEVIQDIFPVLVHYGFIEEKNAQCMQVETSIEVGGFLLIAGILLLHLMSKFVNSATEQYFKETDPSHKRFHLKVEQAMEQEKHLDVPNVSPNDVQPPPVLFTDSYRWVLMRKPDGDVVFHDKPIPEDDFHFSKCGSDSGISDDQKSSVDSGLVKSIPTQSLSSASGQSISIA